MGNDDFVTVPSEPTEAMCKAGEDCDGNSSPGHECGGSWVPENVEKIYKAMIAAAPPSPRSDDKEEDEAYELGKRDGFEEAVQTIDQRTGGDGEFYGSTIPGRGQDVPSMLEGIVERFDELRSPRSEVGEGKWRPIDTAPRDGTRVLLAKAGKSYVTMGRWVESFSEEHFVDGKHGWYNDATQSRYWNPTHWMPLPSFPDARLPVAAEVRVDDDPCRAQCTDNGFLGDVLPSTTTPSGEVGEMVERLHGVAVSIGMEWTAEHRQHVFDTVNQAASLLLALDAERGRLRASRNEVIEMCAKVADAYDISYGHREQQAVSIDVSRGIAASIRALKSREVEP